MTSASATTAQHIFWENYREEVRTATRQRHDLQEWCELSHSMPLSPRGLASA